MKGRTTEGTFLCGLFLLQGGEMQVIKVNGKEIELEKATSVEVYLESAGYQMKRIAVELNGEILPKNEYADRMLEDGDCMEVVTFVGGG